MNTFVERLSRCIETVLGADAGTVVAGPDTNIVNDLRLDSIAMVGLIFLAEQEFHLVLSDYSEQLFEIRTVGQLAQLIEEKGGR